MCEFGLRAAQRRDSKLRALLDRGLQFAKAGERVLRARELGVPALAGGAVVVSSVLKFFKVIVFARAPPPEGGTPNPTSRRHPTSCHSRGWDILSIPVGLPHGPFDRDIPPRCSTAILSTAAHSQLMEQFEDVRGFNQRMIVVRQNAPGDRETRVLAKNFG